MVTISKMVTTFNDMFMISKGVICSTFMISTVMMNNDMLIIGYVLCCISEKIQFYLMYIVKLYKAVKSVFWLTLSND